MTAGHGELLGYEGIQVGDAVVERTGDPATLLLISTKREVLAGDRLFAPGSEEVNRNFMPHAPASPVKGEIVSVIDGVSQIGQNQVVVLNLGHHDGIDQGTVLAVYQRGDTVLDRYAKAPQAEQPASVSLTPAEAGMPPPQNAFENVATSAVTAGREVGDAFANAAKAVVGLVLPRHEGEAITLPDRRAGVVMVFRSFDRVSYALVMKATRSIHLYDLVENP